MTQSRRDHGGGLDAAMARFGGARADWIDLSTGINPYPYPYDDVTSTDWTALPDSAAQQALIDAARRLWRVPPEAVILAAPGASALIALLPLLAAPGRVAIPAPTYNEHAAAFTARGWEVTARSDESADAQVFVHPNNPTGEWHNAARLTAPLCVIDESFCDVAPERSLVALSAQPGRVVLKSFGKFWGLAGLRLGFAFAAPDTIATLAGLLGPWPVAGPALRIGAQALSDTQWADTTRQRLARDAARMDRLLQSAGATPLGGCDLFRLYDVENASQWQTRLASARIWSRIFPYSDRWLRLGLPPSDGWARLEAAL